MEKDTEMSTNEENSEDKVDKTESEEDDKMALKYKLPTPTELPMDEDGKPLRQRIPIIEKPAVQDFTLENVSYKIHLRLVLELKGRIYVCTHTFYLYFFPHRFSLTWIIWPCWRAIRVVGIM